MKVFRVYSGVRGFVRLYDYGLRWTRMITEQAKQRAKILSFWHEHDLKATKDAFGVSRSTLFDWQRLLRKDIRLSIEALNPQSKKPKRLRKRTREWPAEILSELKHLRDIHPNLGKDKLHVDLKAFCEAKQLRCPKPSTIGRLIKDLGGLRTFPAKVSHTGRINASRRGKVLRKPKHLNATYPGHVVALDTIEKILDGSRRYVITMIDHYSRFSFAWATTSHASGAAKEFFTLLRQVFPVPLTYILTDNGSEFKKHFAKELATLHLVHYHTYPKCPRMNPYVERFNRTLQEEFLNFHMSSLLIPDSCNLKMMDYLAWYNTRRPHWSLGLRSPLQFLVDNSPAQSSMSWTDTSACQKNPCSLG